MTDTSPTPQADALVKAVNDAYSLKAREGSSVDYSSRIAKAFGYTPDQLQSIPAESHMGLSCGNPVAGASIKEGERVLDLGSGGGIDILLAAAKVGLQGRAIGLDMSADMIALARKSAAKQNLKPPQVAFVQCSLTGPLPINSESIDCILSNCVVNLLPLSGKAALFHETFRVLKPGGRIVLDDIVAKKPLPDEIRNDLAAHVGCIAGAIEMDLYKKLITDAGFQDVVFADTHGDINIYKDTKDQAKDEQCCPPASCCSPSSGGCAQVFTNEASLAQTDMNKWVASYQIYALKPIPAGSKILSSYPEPLRSSGV